MTLLKELALSEQVLPERASSLKTNQAERSYSQTDVGDQNQNTSISRTSIFETDYIVSKTVHR